MKTYKKVIITVALAFAVWYVCDKMRWVSEEVDQPVVHDTPDIRQGPTSAYANAQPAMDPDELQGYYAGINEEYFGGKLPKSVIIGYGEHDNTYMATTVWRDGQGKFSIQLNTQYTLAHRVEELVMLHEACHVETWTELQPSGAKFVDKAMEHGPRWRACMIRIDSMGANRHILIDGYEETQR